MTTRPLCEENDVKISLKVLANHRPTYVGYLYPLSVGKRVVAYRNTLSGWTTRGGGKVLCKRYITARQVKDFL